MANYKASTEQGVYENFNTTKGDVYAVYISTKWACKNGFDLLEVVRINDTTTSVIFDKDN